MNSKKRKREDKNYEENISLLRQKKKRVLIKKKKNDNEVKKKEELNVEEKFKILFQSVKLSKECLLSLIKGLYYLSSKIKMYSKSLKFLNIAIKGVNDEIKEIDNNHHSFSNFNKEFGVEMMKRNFKEIHNSVVEKIIKDLYKKCLNIEKGEFYQLMVFYRGLCFIRMKEFTSSLVDLTNAIEINKNGFMLDVMLFNRGMVFYKLKNYKKSLIDLYKVIDLVDNKMYKAYIFNYVGLCYRMMKMFKKAIECYDKAIELNPEDEVYYLNKGKNFLKMNMFNEAKTCFNSSIEIVPTIKNCRMKGYVLYKQKKFLEGIYYCTMGINNFFHDDNVFECRRNLTMAKDDRNIMYKLMKRKIIGVNFDVDILSNDWNYFQM